MTQDTLIVVVELDLDVERLLTFPMNFVNVLYYFNDRGLSFDANELDKLAVGKILRGFLNCPLKNLIPCVISRGIGAGGGGAF